MKEEGKVMAFNMVNVQYYIMCTMYMCMCIYMYIHVH